METKRYQKYYQENTRGNNFIINSKTQPWHTHRLKMVADLINQEDFNSILDLGSGRGDIFDMIDDSKQKYAIEINENWQKFLKNKGVNIISNDIFLWLEEISNTNFDIIVATEFFEHFPYYDLLPILKAIRTRMNNKLIFSIPNPASLLARCQLFFKGNYSYSQVSLDHAFMHDLTGWTKLVESTGLRVINSTSAGMKIPKPWGGVWYTHKAVRKNMADYLIFVCSKD